MTRPAAAWLASGQCSASAQSRSHRSERAHHPDDAAGHSEVLPDLDRRERGVLGDQQHVVVAAHKALDRGLLADHGDDDLTVLGGVLAAYRHEVAVEYPGIA